MTPKLKQTFLTVTAMIAILALSLPAVAGQYEKGRGGGKNLGQNRHTMGYSRLWKDPDVIKEMGLSEEQVEGIRQADFSFREEHLKQRAELEQYRLELEKTFSGNSVDKSAVMTPARKIADLRGKMFISEIEFRLDAEKQLTPDQVKKLDTYKKQRFGKNGKNKRRGECRQGQSFE